MAWITEKPGGEWAVRWREGARKRSRSFSTREEAEAQLAVIRRAEAAQKLLSSTPGIPGWGGEEVGADDPAFALESYLRQLIKGNRELRETTRELYLRTLRVHIEGTAIGRADLRQLTPLELNTWWGNLTCGRGALGQIAQLLSMGFKRAVRDDLIPSNPLERADIRKPSAKGARQVRPLTVAEVERLAAAAPTPRDRMEVLLMAYCGLRAGEVGGLRVEDVDWQRGRLSVRQQVTRLHGELIVGEPKTPAARRVVTIPASVLEELRAYVDANPGDPILRGELGSPRDAIRINRSVQRAAKRAGLRTHAHALRHTFVSLLVADGASPVDIQHAVGHSNIQTTLAQYAHLFSYGGEHLAASLEARRAALQNS